MASEFAYAEAYPRKDEVGGGFRGVACVNGERIETAVTETQFAAWAAIDGMVRERIGERPFGYGHLRGNRFKKYYYLRGN